MRAVITGSLMMFMRLGNHSPTPAKFRGVMAGLAVFLVAAASPALAQPEGKLAIELNKLAQEDAACRFYFLLENGTGYALTDVTVEFAFFDTDGIFAYRNLFSFGKLRAARNKLASFTLEQLRCPQVGRVLLNEVIDCGLPEAVDVDCDALVTIRHRTGAAFVR